MTSAGRGLEAPHRRASGPPRIVEKAAVAGYRASAWVVGRVPPPIADAVLGVLAQASYLAWPAKRRWSNANYGHVLGLPPDHPRVRRLALAAYREYGRYLAEVMRLPMVSAEEAGTFVAAADFDSVEPIWQESPGGMIFTVGHIGSNEAVGAGIAHRGWPISVVADDSAFPELYDDFRRLREGWGIHLIPWRNLREIYAVLKRREILALLVDWGYRADGVPVRLFDAWTCLPAGPATLAAKTRSTIVPLAIRRSGGRYHVTAGEAIRVPSASPADIAVATQRIADALAASIAAAPEQWYNFKPIWPETAEESAALERRAAAMLRGDEPAPSVAGATQDVPDARDAPAASYGGGGLEAEPS